MTSIKLSICIPTYNFGKFIGETLDSILHQYQNDIEIIVGDGASTDNTEEIIKDYLSDFPGCISYYKFDVKGGIDRDLIRTIEMARGEYCWLLSSDDVLRPEAIARVLNEIQVGHSIYLCNRWECDQNLNKPSSQLWLSEDFNDQVFNLSNSKELHSYLKSAQSLGALFSFMSSIIVKRSVWMGIDNPQVLMGSNYAHVYRLFSIAMNGGLLKYIEEPLISARFGNDSFMEHGLAKRFLIDLNGYQLLANKLFQDQALKNKFKSVMRKEHQWYKLPSLAGKIKIEDDWIKLSEGFRSFGYHPALLYASRKLGQLSFFNYIYTRYKKYSL